MSIITEAFFIKWQNLCLLLTFLRFCDKICKEYAPVAELADAPDLGSGVYDVGVQVPSGA